MSERPTLHLTNWSSRSLHGPGRKLTIMREPRAWEHGEGRVLALTPTRLALHAVWAGSLTFEEYAEVCRADFSRCDLRPGVLHLDDGQSVADGDTLCCACSRAEAAVPLEAPGLRELTDDERDQLAASRARRLAAIGVGVANG